ncbi:methylaspartate mutase [Micromonospora eburnea]|uniref:Glutamate mutase subunit E n=1 Tax=Micromonospora eburnea TaxID=227316 RepID=A0A1C6UJ13_9ACTN|nr:methylaspartate mutase [Micromonospora eburnea]SCL53938.1 Glutamate mutase subunit E [Micromonospora eburnea]
MTIGRQRAHPSPASPARPEPGSFGAFVNAAQQAGDLVVQPRMGVADPARMRAGLVATKRAAATTVGTITVDSFTRLGDHAEARRALAKGVELNGYPIVTHGPDVTRAMLDGVAGADFPVQVRHGSSQPEDIFRTLLRSGLSATEGGPVSYCLPYSRSPLRESVDSWARCVQWFASLEDLGVTPHLETFGGCLLGQLCPPSLLIATSVLEAMFLRQHGLRSISLSYAQQTNAAQDEEALMVLRRIATEVLRDIDWHVVVYTYMGMYPRSPAGSALLLAEAAKLAVRTGSARLIVKTVAEAYRIPTIAENVTALEWAAKAALDEESIAAGTTPDTGIYAEARALIDTVLELDPDIGRALVIAFASGLLDVPFCLHPDNRGEARSYVDTDGWLRWSLVGAMPIEHIAQPSGREHSSSADLLASLSYVARKFGQAAVAGPLSRQPPTAP